MKIIFFKTTISERKWHCYTFLNGIVIHLYMDSAVCLCIQCVAINSFGLKYMRRIQFHTDSWKRERYFYNLLR